MVSILAAVSKCESAFSGLSLISSSMRPKPVCAMARSELYLSALSKDTWALSACSRRKYNRPNRACMAAGSVVDGKSVLSWAISLLTPSDLFCALTVLVKSKIRARIRYMRDILQMRGRRACEAKRVFRLFVGLNVTACWVFQLSFLDRCLSNGYYKIHCL